MKCLAVALTALALLVLASEAALSKPTTPPKSFTHDLLRSDRIDRRGMPPVDIASHLERDAKHRDKPAPYRVAVATPLDVDTESAGTWETIPGVGRVWRFRVDSPGAVFMSFKFSDFDLPEGAELHFISATREYHDGAYRSRHNRPSRRFGSPMIPGDAAIIELFVPEGSRTASLELESVSHGFRNVMRMGSFPHRGGPHVATDPSYDAFTAAAPESFSCQRDINCAEGAPYQDVKRAAAEGYDGAYICSGQLINNARQDNRYLYLTADHCEWWIDPPTMSYYWNYENSTCGSSDAPLRFSTGSTDLYHNASADLDLLELDGTDLESQYDIYFVGWNRSNATPTSAATIGFPSDKPKQVSIRYTPVTDCAPGGCSGGWGPNYWRIDAYDVGVPEGGSSGGMLLDQDNLLVGTLTGGVGTNCNNFTWDEYAKIAPHWASLQPFLDPNNTGAITLLGKDHSTIPGVPLSSGWSVALLATLLLVVGGFAIWIERTARPARR
jgi:lysyl endopeptidase